MRSIRAFDRDAAAHGGYLYTAGTTLSGRMATQRALAAILGNVRLQGQTVLDMGCGDGYYTIRICDRAKPRGMVGIDAAPHAIAVAELHVGDRPIRFSVRNAHRLDYPPDSFDVVLLQSILHHDDNPRRLLGEAFRLARQVVLFEPNGNNPGMKVVERVSSYHRMHQERSYLPRTLARWVRASGGLVTRQAFVCLVPVFCPDWLARSLKAVEPLVERVPVLRAVACSGYLLVAERR